MLLTSRTITIEPRFTKLFGKVTKFKNRVCLKFQVDFSSFFFHAKVTYCTIEPRDISLVSVLRNKLDSRNSYWWLEKTMIKYRKYNSDWILLVQNIIYRKSRLDYNSKILVDCSKNQICRNSFYWILLDRKLRFRKSRLNFMNIILKFKASLFAKMDLSFSKMDLYV